MAPTTSTRARERNELRGRIAAMLAASDAYEFEPTCERERRAYALADVIVEALAPAPATSSLPT